MTLSLRHLDSGVDLVVQYSVMATPQHKAQCIIWLVQSESVITMQRSFRLQYGCGARTPTTIRNLLTYFKKSSSVLKGKSPEWREVEYRLDFDDIPRMDHTWKFTKR